MLTIGKLSKQARVSTDSVRFYERQGLMSVSTKNSSGYRLYSEEAVRRIAFIKHAQRCGFSLTEIKTLIDLPQRNGTCRKELHRMASEKRGEIENTISALRAMSEALAGLMRSCADEEPQRSHDASRPHDVPLLAALEARIAQFGMAGASASPA